MALRRHPASSSRHGGSAGRLPLPGFALAAGWKRH